MFLAYTGYATVIQKGVEQTKRAEEKHIYLLRAPTRLSNNGNMVRRNMPPLPAFTESISPEEDSRRINNKLSLMIRRTHTACGPQS